MKRVKWCAFTWLAASLAATSALAAPSARFRLPEESGLIVAENWPDPSRPLVVLIQDMHGNPEVQGHIGDCLEWAAMSLADWRPEDQRLALAVEGASGDVSWKSGWGLENNEEKERILARRMQAGLLDGAERFALMHEAPVWMFGAETPELYTAAQSRISLFFTAENQSRLRTLQGLCLAGARRKLGPGLRQLDFLYYQGLSEGVDAPKIAQAVWQWAQPQKRRALWEKVWKENAGLPVRQRLDVAFEVLANAAASGPEQEFLKHQRYVWEMEQMAWLAASPAGAAGVVADCLEHHGTAGQEAFRYVQDLAAAEPEKMPLTEKEFQVLRDELADFYQLNRQRDRAFVENMAANLEKRGWRNVVLVAGGFHAAGVMEECRARNFNFVVIRPAGEEQKNASAYYDLLRMQIRPTPAGH
jgi:hypothetical protein